MVGLTAQGWQQLVLTLPNPPLAVMAPLSHKDHMSLSLLSTLSFQQKFSSRANGEIFMLDVNVT